jgi:hypothetical protein
MIVVETGTGNPLSNAYTDPAGAVAVAYFGGHLYSTVWDDADAPTRAKAMMMATRVIDGNFAFSGNQATPQQGLAWPRVGVVLAGMGSYYGATVTSGGQIMGGGTGGYLVPSNEIPVKVQQAACEQALALLSRDRTDSSGTVAQVTTLELGDKALVLGFGAGDPNAAPVTPLSDACVALLALYGRRTDAAGGMRRVFRA